MGQGWAAAPTAEIQSQRGSSSQVRIVISFAEGGGRVFLVGKVSSLPKRLFSYLFFFARSVCFFFA